MIVEKIDSNWNFKEAVQNIEAIRVEVRETLASFSYFDKKKSINYKKIIKNKIFSFNFEYWKRERLLEYVYGDFSMDDLLKLR